MNHIEAAIKIPAATAKSEWWLVFVVTIVSLLATADRTIIALFVNDIKRDLGLSDTSISLVLGAGFALSNIAITLPAGWAADRLSRRAILAGSVTVWSFMLVMCGAASSFLQLLMARAGVGVGQAPVPPNVVSLIRDGVSNQRRGRAISVQTMAYQAGVALALMLGGFLVEAVRRSGVDHLPLIGHVYPWQLCLVIMGVGGMPIALLVYTMSDPARAKARTPQKSAGYGEALIHVRENWRLYAPLLIFQVSGWFVSASFGAWLPAHIGRTWAIGPAEMGAMFGLLTLMLPPIGLLSAGYLIDRYRDRGSFPTAVIGVAAAVVVGVMGTILPLIPQITSFWVVLSVILAMSFVPVTVYTNITASVAPPPLLGRIVAMQFFVNGIAMIGAPTIAAIVAEHAFSGPRALSHALSTVVAVYGVVQLVAAIAVALELRTRRRAKAD